MDEISTDAECSRRSLTTADLDGIDVYDFDMYVEPGCTQAIGRPPHGCNFMGLGRGCRSCFETCEGALYYMKMHKKEIKKKVGQTCGLLVWNQCCISYPHAQSPFWCRCWCWCSVSPFLLYCTVVEAVFLLFFVEIVFLPYSSSN